MTIFGQSCTRLDQSSRDEEERQPTSSISTLREESLLFFHGHLVITKGKEARGQQR